MERETGWRGGGRETEGEGKVGLRRRDRQTEMGGEGGGRQMMKTQKTKIVGYFWLVCVCGEFIFLIIFSLSLSVITTAFLKALYRSITG